MRNLAMILTVAAVAQSPSFEYRITHSYTLGGDGSWDYIVPDPPNHRLFIGPQNRVMVVDEDRGTLPARSPASTVLTVPPSRRPPAMGSPHPDVTSPS